DARGARRVCRRARARRGRGVRRGGPRFGRRSIRAHFEGRRRRRELTAAMAAERLQKILAQAGVSSRRAAEALIRAGRVSVNGAIVTELGTKADAAKDEVCLDGERLRPPRARVLAFHKPSGVVTTLSDPEGRPTIRSCLPSNFDRVFPIGRLDFHSSGLLL